MKPLKAGWLPRRFYILGALAIALTVALSILLLRERGLLARVSAYGYAGLLVMSFLGGATVVIPIPSLLLTFALGSVLSPVWVGLVSGLGEALGGLTIYISGVTGRALLDNNESVLYERILRWVRHRGALMLFIFSAIINPFYYPMTIAAGVLHFGIWRFFFITWAGKTIKCTIVAYIGFLGLRSLLRLAGIEF